MKSCLIRKPENSRMNTRQKGRDGETAAVEYLLEKRYRIVKRNFALRSGEIDIIAEQDKNLHFIEVKTWKVYGKDSLAYSIDRNKIKKIKETSLFFLHTHSGFDDYNIRYDLIFVSGTTGEIDHIENAY